MIAKITVLCLLVVTVQPLAISVANGGLGLGSSIGLGGLSNGIGLGLTNGLGLGGNLIGGAGLLGGHGITIQQPIAIAHQPIAIAHQPVAIAHQPVAIAHERVVDLHAPAQYEFKYAVQDAHTGDNKQQSEARIGDTVKGEYSLAEPDGTIRVVKYTADPHNGFNAVVSRIGKAAHPQVIQKAVALAAPTLISSHGLGLGLGLH